jgi:hypothetical protein
MNSDDKTLLANINRIRAGQGLRALTPRQVAMVRQNVAVREQYGSAAVAALASGRVTAAELPALYEPVT